MKNSSLLPWKQIPVLPVKKQFQKYFFPIFVSFSFLRFPVFSTASVSLSKIEVIFEASWRKSKQQKKRKSEKNFRREKKVMIDIFRTKSQSASIKGCKFFRFSLFFMLHFVSFWIQFFAFYWKSLIFIEISMNNRIPNKKKTHKFHSLSFAFIFLLIFRFFCRFFYHYE